MLWVRKVRGAILIGDRRPPPSLAIDRRGDRQHRRQPTPPAVDNPGGWGLNVPSCRTRSSTTPDFDAARPLLLLGSFGSVGVVVGAAARLHADAGRLLRHHGHDDRDRRRGRAARRGGHPAEHPADPDRRLASPRPPVARPASSQHVLHRVRLGRRRGRPDRARLAWSPACCSCSRCSWRRWSTVIPSEAAAPALVLVGFLMMQQVKGIDWDDLEIAIPAFLTIVLMPFTYSITVGIGAGFIAYVVIKVVRGKAAQVHPLLWVVAGPVRRLLRPGPAHLPGELSTRRLCCATLRVCAGRPSCSPRPRSPRTRSTWCRSPPG